MTDNTARETPVQPDSDDLSEQYVSEIEQEIERLRAENAALTARLTQGQKELTFKVSEKSGAVSVYGLGRFPVSLYRDQWNRLMAAIPRLHAFITERNVDIVRFEMAAKADRAAK